MPQTTRKKPRKKLTLKKAFKEVSTNEPKVVKQTRRKKGAAAAKKQKVAIALSKAKRKRA